MENEKNILSNTDSIKPEEKENSSKTKPKYSDEYLLTYLKELAIKLGRTPSIKDIIKDKKIKGHIILIRFGNLGNAQKQAGLVPIIRGNARTKKYQHEYSKIELINNLKELAIKLGRTPSINDINKNGEIKTPYFLKCFKKISIAQNAAGLIPTKIGNVKNKTNILEYSKEDLLNHLKELAIKLGRTPSMLQTKFQSNYFYYFCVINLKRK